MRIKCVGLFLLILALLSGCAIRHESRLYDLETGDVIIFRSLIRGNRATSEGTLPSGEKCKGESVAGGVGAISWGNIYSYYYGSVNYLSASIEK